jgi:hypothetical protein
MSRYSFDYLHFVKTFLVNACYIKFCKEIYVCTNTNTYAKTNASASANASANTSTNQSEYKELLVSSKNDQQIWDKVFTDDTHDLLLYYLYLSTDPTRLLASPYLITYSQNRVAQVYKHYPSFQDFIDSNISFQKIGASEYQKFTVSMQDSSFKNKMIDKYTFDSELKTLKNHLMYVVQLSVRRDMLDTFTHAEAEDIDLMIDAVPYFVHIAKNRWTLDQITHGTIHHGIGTGTGTGTNTDNSNLELGTFYSIETRVMQQFNRLFQ